jgi:hypothetical protein
MSYAMTTFLNTFAKINFVAAGVNEPDNGATSPTTTSA